MRRGLAVLITALMGVPACAGCTGPSPAAYAPGSPDGSASLEVANNYTLPMEVYATGSGMSVRMGTIAPGAGAHFVIRAAMLRNGPVEVLAQPSGGGSVIRSGPMGLSAGQTVDFLIGTDPINSTASVRPAPQPQPEP